MSTMTREGAETFLRGLPALTAAERASDTVVLLKTFAESWLALEARLANAEKLLAEAVAFSTSSGTKREFYKRRSAFLVAARALLAKVKQP